MKLLVAVIVPKSYEYVKAAAYSISSVLNEPT